MKNLLKWFIAILALLVIIYFLGPKPAKPVYSADMPAVPSNAAELEAYVNANEARHKLKPDNEARIIWANDSARKKTPYAFVYLHGFSASQEEGEPVHRNVAKDFGCNLYLSRLAEHGIDTIEPMTNLTATKYWESAKQALAIGKQLGDKVILLSTSTGGTNALQLAATYPNDVFAIVLMSPNIAIDNDKAYLLNNPWGLQIAELVTGSDHVTAKDDRLVYKQYWYSHYPVKSAAELQELLETTMTTETFKKVKQPVLMLYYYKDAVHRDSVVSIDAMLHMFNELGTSSGKKIKFAVQNAGNHVIGSYIKSKDVNGVQGKIEDFLIKVTGLKKV